MRVSMMLSVRASRPTSVLLFSPGTRSVRFPPAIDSAAVSMSRSGRSPRRTSQNPAMSAMSTAPAVTISSITFRWLSVLWVSVSG